MVVSICTCWGDDFVAAEEWKSRAFEEGIATFFADAAMYQDTAVEPASCNSISYCDGTDSELETNSDCDEPENQGRWALSYMRGLWDTYDEHNDSESTNWAYWYHFTALNEFPSGTGFWDAGGVWDDTYSYFDEPDVRSAIQYRYWMYSRRGVWVDVPFLNNCLFDDD